MMLWWGSVGLAAGLTAYFIWRGKGKGPAEIEVLQSNLFWRQCELPILVFVDKSAARWADTVVRSIAWWNRITPGLFRYCGVQEDVLPLNNMVIIFEMELGTQNESGHTRLNRGENGVLQVAPIRVGNLTPRRKWFRVICHELGHVLGLTHNVHRMTSVMYPRAVDVDFDCLSDERCFLAEQYQKPSQ